MWRGNPKIKNKKNVTMCEKEKTIVKNKLIIKGLEFVL